MGATELKVQACRTDLVYPDQPVFCGVGLLKNIKLKVFVTNLSIAHTIISRGSF